VSGEPSSPSLDASAAIAAVGGLLGVAGSGFVRRDAASFAAFRDGLLPLVRVSTFGFDACFSFGRSAAGG
jgi:hypothetical protein